MVYNGKPPKKKWCGGKTHHFFGNMHGASLKKRCLGLPTLFSSPPSQYPEALASEKRQTFAARNVTMTTLPGSGAFS